MNGFFRFFVILVLVLAGWVAYPMAMGFFRDMNWLPAKDKAVAAATPATAPPTDAATMTPEPAPAAPVETAPPVDPVDSPASVDTSDETIAARIPMPAIKPLEDITANWTRVPLRAFPPAITSSANVSFPMAQGNSMTVAAGTEVVPVAIAPDGKLIVAPSAQSSLRTTLPLDQTDFKAKVTERYNQGVARIRENIEARRNAERQRMQAAATATADQLAAAGDVPRDSSDEARYLAIMRKSVAQGELPGVSTEQVKAWRWIGYEEIDGTGYWTGAAVIMKETYFGEFETEAKALIRKGSVEKWTLPGVE